MCNKYLLERYKVSVYPSSGVDTNIFRRLSLEEVNSKFKKYNIDKNLVTFCYVGRISANKGWDTYLEAIKMLKARKEKLILFLSEMGLKTVNLKYWQRK